MKKLYNLTNRTCYKLENIKQNNMSEKFTLNKDDAQKIFKNALTFLAPALLIFLVQIQAGVEVREAIYAVYLWGLNTLIDLIKKFIQGN